MDVWAVAIPGEGSSLWKNHKGRSQLSTVFIVWGAVNSCRAEDRECRRTM